MDFLQITTAVITTLITVPLTKFLENKIKKQSLFEDDNNSISNVSINHSNISNSFNITNQNSFNTTHIDKSVHINNSNKDNKSFFGFTEMILLFFLAITASVLFYAKFPIIIYPLSSTLLFILIYGEIKNKKIENKSTIWHYFFSCIISCLILIISTTFIKEYYVPLSNLDKIKLGWRSQTMKQLGLIIYHNFSVYSIIFSILFVFITGSFILLTVSALFFKHKIARHMLYLQPLFTIIIIVIGKLLIK